MTFFTLITGIVGGLADLKNLFAFDSNYNETITILILAIVLATLIYNGERYKRPQQEKGSLKVANTYKIICIILLLGIMAVLTIILVGIIIIAIVIWGAIIFIIISLLAVALTIIILVALICIEKVSGEHQRRKKYIVDEPTINTKIGKK